MNTEDQNKHLYEENGFLLLKSDFPDDVLSEVAHEILEIFRKNEEASGYSHGKNKYSRFATELHLQNDVFAEFVQREFFYKICNNLLGRDVDLRFSSTITKTKEHGTFLDWHQDAIYDRDPSPYMNRITCWTAITNSDKENGCIRLIPGSHKTGLLKHIESEVYPPNLQCIEIDESKSIPIEMVPGQILVIHPLLAHSSGPNLSGSNRIAMMVGYQKPKLVYKEIEIKWGYRFIKEGKKVWEKLN